jgi:hypothetical protein
MMAAAALGAARPLGLTRGLSRQAFPQETLRACATGAK